ncbi:MAG: Folylpolyglutamate synthetase [Geoglossum simile]|nr:MAG: Folylpolyglutamate synthetase [Geoglossum simile]
MPRIHRKPVCSFRSVFLAYPVAAPRSRFSTRTGMEGNNTYAAAIDKLNSLQSGFAVLKERRRMGLKLDSSAVGEMRQWAHRIGYAPRDFDRLNIVHVAGTKGKGSACAYANSILTAYHTTVGLPKKIGLYTSPHLIAVRERMRINSELISESLFAKYFFEVWDALERSAVEQGLDPKHKPVYFRFLTLLSFHVFMREGVDAAIYEVGIGGAWDSTNIIEQPVATGITTLGIDHTEVLGETIEKIAWHKAGVFKAGCPAFSVAQLPAAATVLQQRAKEKKTLLRDIAIHPALHSINITPNEGFQRANASLAIALVDTVLKRLGIPRVGDETSLPEQYIEGLERTVWRGRCETKLDGDKTWYLDGAHTKESLEVAGHWFGRAARRSTPRILIFNQQSPRDAVSLMKSLHHSLYAEHGIRFDHVIFCTNKTYRKGYRSELANRNTDPISLSNLTLQREFAAAWVQLDRGSKANVVRTIEEAVEYVEQLSREGGEVQVLVTGSFHLVGGVLAILEGEGATA